HQIVVGQATSPAEVHRATPPGEFCKRVACRTTPAAPAGPLRCVCPDAPTGRMPALPGLTTRRGSWTRLLCMVPIRFWLACSTAFIGSAALAADADSGPVPAPPRRAAMDYGSMLTYTVGLRDAPGKSNANIALKGVCIRLGPSNADADPFEGYVR